MRERGLRARAPRRKARTTDPRPGPPAADHLPGRDFAPAGPDAAWSADIAYIPAADGWLYPAVVEDLFSRVIAGRPMGATMTGRLVAAAPSMAVSRRLPGGGLVAHSGRGGRYAGGHYRRLLPRHGITGSMGRAAQCRDNAPAESVFAGLKREPAHDEYDASREQAEASIFEDVEAFDHRVRLPSSLGHVCPAEHERSHNPKRP
jgi:transposase InsO family protein